MLNTVNPLYSDGFSHNTCWCSKYGIVHFALLGVKARIFLIMVYFCQWRFVLILANSVDPDEMQQYAAFHLGLHCLQKYPFRGFQYTMG